MENSEEIWERILKLKGKFDASGQDMMSYLDGLMYADYITYWDYINLDVLLNLQQPRTQFPDEKIFIIYHQITELYFKLVLLELEQIAFNEKLDSTFLLLRIKRCNRYFENLIKSFAVMVDGMEVDQFLKFRMALLPASGFQSAQYRKIEIFTTDFIQLVDKNHRENFVGDEPIEKMIEFIYWKAGATELATGKKTLTLEQFERKYTKELTDLGVSLRNRNLKARALEFVDGKDWLEIKTELRKFDEYVNVFWPLSHYKSAVRYLHKSPEDIAATGGTNWQKYLPPRFQKRVFFPEFWTAEELDQWGRKWVSETLSELKDQ